MEGGAKIKLVNRVERHKIKRSNIYWEIIDELCFKSKNLYNYANFMIRQEFIKNGSYKDDYEMSKELKTHEPFKELGSGASQKTLAMLHRSWKSYFVTIKDWAKNPHKYLGKPKLPKYKDKNGRYPVVLSNIQFKIKNSRVIFSWKPLSNLSGAFTTSISGRPTEIRFIPNGSVYIMEIVYRIEVPDVSSHTNRVVGIDMGVNNLATMSNNIGEKPIIINGKIIKSINQYYNKKRSKLLSLNNCQWSNKLQNLTDKYMNKVDYNLHKISKYVIVWCAKNKIDTIVIGKNARWKQNSKMSRKVNQSFVQIPHAKLIDKIMYKAENAGIKVIITEESYTSGTSFLDGELPVKENHNKKRRIKRGLFVSNNGIQINADLNGAYQIVRKVFPDIFDGIEGVGLHPIRVNVC